MRKYDYMGKDSFILGLDIGIGSVGYALINETKGYIELLNSVIFSSGEDGAHKSSDRDSQVTRAYRSSKRLNKRRKQRKNDIKRFLNNIGFYDQEWQQNSLPKNIIKYRCKGLDYQLDRDEIIAIILYFLNHRGYKDFYELVDSDDGSANKNELSKMQEAKKATELLLESNKYRTIGEMLYIDPTFKDDGIIKYRNNGIKKGDKKEANYKYLFSRKDNKEELRLILTNQSKYYSEFNDTNIEFIINRIFNQRDFEEGPGPKKGTKIYEAYLHNLKGQRVYTGFDELIGKCSFYPDENRFTKNSLVYEEFVFINTLSQYKIYDINTGEMKMPSQQLFYDCLEEIDDKGQLSFKKLEKILQKYNLSILKNNRKTIFMDFPFYNYLMHTNLLDDGVVELLKNEIKHKNIYSDDCLCNKIGIAVTKWITPERRRNELKKILNTDISDGAITYKSLGTANTSKKYMKEAIEAYYNGVIYGEFQAEKNKQLELISNKKVLMNDDKILPITDPDLIRNPVVFRSVNQTRKVINNILKYYNVTKINIEVAREVSASFEQRKEMEKFQNDNEKKNKELEDKLLSMLLENGYNIPINKALIDRFKLWIEQKEKCIYTGAKIEFKDLLNRNSELNIDHIIPQSIILDDTLSNKVLTFTNVNAVKTDRIPMQCLDLLIHNGCSYNVKQYKDNIKKLGLSKKKTQYLLLDELSDDVVDGFVSRNINDTRYITRYITNYLKSAFDESGLNIEVNAIKGSVTSTYRKKWLTKYDTKKGLVPSIYALDEKGRNLHYYHHAIDACILANIKKEYIVLSGFIDTILNINRDKRLTQTNKTIEINKITEKAVKTMTEHYHMSEDYVRKVIKYNRIPSVCKNLYEEIPLRVPLEFIFKEDTSLYEFINDKKKYRKLMHYVKELKLNSENHELFDNEIAKEFNELIKHFELPCHIDLENNSYYEKELCININDSKLFKSNGFKEKELKDYLENIKMVDSKTYKDNCLMYYKDNLLDNDFINNINIQYIQFMKERKFSGRMVGSDVPVSLDKALEETNKALNKRNKGCGKIINNFIEFEDYLNDPYNIKPAVNYYIKWNNKGNNNYSIYNAQKYYCAEQYSSTDGHVYIRGIRYFDILNKNGHLYLKKPLPEGYQHICYLFTNDCISVFNKSGKLKSNGFGFYKSIDSANQNTVIMRLFNNKKISNSDVILKLNDSFIKKYELDCFGHIEGEIKCGDQSLFTIEKQ